MFQKSKVFDFYKKERFGSAPAPGTPGEQTAAIEFLT